ncbi:hypothetical protein T12_13303 [Trichinella patagoniensis]|uniref:Uncharacterized protein n=1 Tax=Trichinella patagoniensis TaxID=990121 RepID=A0A0V0ZLU9_9BILA|nr:hypothetical protein T12_13303 [Trichinella patagoniensis]
MHYFTLSNAGNFVIISILMFFVDFLEITAVSDKRFCFSLSSDKPKVSNL